MLDPITSRFFHNGGQQGPIVLMYHSVEPGDSLSDWAWSISLDLFKEHLELLYRNGWKTRTLADLAHAPAGSLAPKTVAITFDDGFENNLDAVEALIDRGMRATWFIVTGSIGEVPHWGESGRPDCRVLGVESLREMQSTGMEIGSHSVSHRRLPALTDQQLRFELTRSKQTLEDIIGGPVESFAYPYGAWDQRCEFEVAEAGYRVACTTQSGAALKDNHPLRLRRLTVFNHDSAATIARKLTLLSNEGGWTTMTSYYSARAFSRLRQQLGG
ncbi:polysaccharide deacetylase family protein [Seongchinamella sediminis]|uniref:Polysaccharide deacetylase family protein n=1 Tax=Seongchinamella sediminis TaxID=2283635 RepID=A0A3L7DVY6_9GAMM|nr:polysaccharide deacetylase family protein [Seongchinamella sediminis]RLQ20770.1 polysaccharide deacetylase family protein [Seongchinamella sediminis]